MSFICGLEMADETMLESFECLVIECLSSVARDGISVDRVESALHQLELSQRELGGDGMPYGLQMMFSGLPAVVHRGDPIGLLDFDRALRSLRQALGEKGPRLIGDWVQKELIDNPHRLRLALGVEEDFVKIQDVAERNKLVELREAMTADDVSKILTQTIALNERQNMTEDLSCLPKVGLSDVPTDKFYPRPVISGALTGYGTGCNGLVYQQLLVPISP